MEFMYRIIGLCFRECLDRYLNVQVVLMKLWEIVKFSFGDFVIREEIIDFNFLIRLVVLWEVYDQMLGNFERELYDELEIIYKQM